MLVFLSVLALATSRVDRLLYPSTDSGRTCAPRLKLFIIISIISQFVNTVLFIYRAYILPYIYLYILLLPQKTHRSINVLYIIYTYRLYKSLYYSRENCRFLHTKSRPKPDFDPLACSDSSCYLVINVQLIQYAYESIGVASSVILGYPAWWHMSTVFYVALVTFSILLLSPL